MRKNLKMSGIHNKVEKKILESIESSVNLGVLDRNLGIPIESRNLHMIFCSVAPLGIT